MLHPFITLQRLSGKHDLPWFIYNCLSTYFFQYLNFGLPSPWAIITDPKICNWCLVSKRKISVSEVMFTWSTSNFLSFRGNEGPSVISLLKNYLFLWISLNLRKLIFNFTFIFKVNSSNLWVFKVKYSFYVSMYKVTFVTFCLAIIHLFILFISHNGVWTEARHYL